MVSKTVKQLTTSLGQAAHTRSMSMFDDDTHNVYETIHIIGKRAGQINTALREELQGKLVEFSSSQDSLEEMTENEEQISLSRSYERMPNPALLATEEFLRGKVYFRNPHNEEKQPA